MHRKAIAAAAGLLATSLAASLAAIAPPGLAAVTKASARDDFYAAAAVIEDGFGPPAEHRVPTAAAVAAVARMHTAMAAFGTAAFPVDGKATFLDVCGPVSNLPMQFAVAGGDPATAADPASNATAVVLLENANLQKYQEPLVMMLADNVKCTALHMPWVEQYWQSQASHSAQDLSDAHQMRDGYAQMLLGATGAGMEADLRPANRALPINAAARYADGVVTNLSLAQRHQIQAQLDATPGLAKTWPTQYAAITKALARTDCNALCAVP